MGHGLYELAALGGSLLDEVSFAVKKLSRRDPEPAAQHRHGHGVISVPVYSADHGLRMHAMLFGQPCPIYLIEIDHGPNDNFSRVAISQKLKGLYVSIYFHFLLYYVLRLDI